MASRNELKAPGEVASTMGVCAETVRRWVRAGKVAYTRTPGKRGDIRVVVGPDGRPVRKSDTDVASCSNL